MTDTRPLVSMGLPVYNGANYIREMLDSIAAQTYENFELIITDNASTDETADIINSYAKDDPRIHYYLNEKNLGASGNFNRCYEFGIGKYFKWLAHDDYLGLNFLEICVSELEANPELIGAYGITIGIDENGDLLPDGVLGETTKYSDDPALRFANMIGKIGDPSSLVFGIFKRSVLEKTTLHRPYYSSDRAFLAELAILGNIAFFKDAVYYCRDHKSRSINIDDKVERSKWISGKSNRFVSAEHSNLARHLFEISGRHRSVVSPWEIRWQLLKYCGHPRQLSRYGLELLSLVSPRFVYWLKARVLFSKKTSGIS